MFSFSRIKQRLQYPNFVRALYVQHSLEMSVMEFRDEIHPNQM